MFVHMSLLKNETHAIPANFIFISLLIKILYHIKSASKVIFESLYHKSRKNWIIHHVQGSGKKNSKEWFFLRLEISIRIWKIKIFNNISVTDIALRGALRLLRLCRRIGWKVGSSNRLSSITSKGTATKTDVLLRYRPVRTHNFQFFGISVVWFSDKFIEIDQPLKLWK